MVIRVRPPIDRDRGTAKSPLRPRRRVRRVMNDYRRGDWRVVEAWICAMVAR